MIPYFLCFMFSIILIYLYEKLYSKETILATILASFSVLLVAIFAGLRDYTVGRDITVYGNVIFETISHCQTFSSAMQLSSVLSIEKGYLILNFLVSRISDNPHFFYFILELITSLFIFGGISNFKDRVSPTFSWFVYLFVFYPQTLNLLRQSVALAIVFWGISLYFKNRKIMSFLVILLATMFHFSAIMGLALLLILFLQEKFKLRMKFFLVVIAGGVSMTVLTNVLIPALINYGLLNEKYSFYVGNQQFEGMISIASLYRIFPVVLMIYSFKSKIFKNSLLFYLLLITVLELTFIPLKSVSEAFYRMVFYINYFRIISFPLIVKESKSPKAKVFLRMFMIAYCLGYFLYFHVVMAHGIGTSWTYPYTSEILNIK